MRKDSTRSAGDATYAEADELVARVRERAVSERAGLFGPDSVTWSVLRETALLLGGPRALLLQLAPPSVAAGVEQHSVIGADPLGRSVRTFTAMYTLCFGDLAAALAVVRAVRRRHDVVGGRDADGADYHALDPALLRWVHATLFDTTVRTFETFVRPLDEAERARFQRESTVVQMAFGVPPGQVLATPADFDRYFAGVLSSGVLHVTAHAASQWEMLMHQPPSHAFLGALMLPPSRGLKLLIDGLPALLTPTALRLFAAGTLPPAVRAAYGLRWSRPDAAAYALTVGGLRGAYAVLPRRLRFHPAYHRAIARMRGGEV